MNFVNMIRNNILKTFMIILAVITIYPLVFSLLAGFIKKDEFTHYGKLLPITAQPVLTWYKAFFSPIGFVPFMNTVYRTCWYTFITILMACLVGYVLSRMNFPGKNFFFSFIIATQVVPGVLLLIPTFLMASKVPFFGGNNWLGQGGHGLINNPVIIYIIVSSGNIIWIFLFRQAMNSLPRSFEESATIDGSGFFRTLFMIVIPMQKAIIAVIALNVAIGTWNDWLTPFIYINDLKYSTLPAYIGKLTTALQAHGDRNLPLVFALSTIVSIPTLAIFLTFQKYLVQGLASVGIKG